MDWKGGLDGTQGQVHAEAFWCCSVRLSKSNSLMASDKSAHISVQLPTNAGMTSIQHKLSFHDSFIVVSHVTLRQKCILQSHPMDIAQQCQNAFRLVTLLGNECCQQGLNDTVSTLQTC